MLTLQDQISRRRTPWLVLLMAVVLTTAIMPSFSTSGQAVAQENEGDGAEEEKKEETKTGTASERSFLEWMFAALGWFWMTVFAALSFVMVALIMMNVLQDISIIFLLILH